jgi:signal transduction histidine kinase
MMISSITSLHKLRPVLLDTLGLSEALLELKKQRRSQQQDEFV